MRHKVLVIDDEGVTPIVAHVVPPEGDEVRHGWAAQHSAEGGLVVGRRSGSPQRSEHWSEEASRYAS